MKKSTYISLGISVVILFASSTSWALVKGLHLQRQPKDYLIECTAQSEHITIDVKGETWYTDNLLQAGKSYVIKANNNGTKEPYDDEIITIYQKIEK